MAVTRLNSFAHWDYYSPLEAKLITLDASDTPFITYDNGLPCYEANLYMHQLLVTAKSRRVKGGTLRTYANQIIHLVRFCFRNETSFSQLTDATFTLFIRGLQAERNAYGELKRSNNQIISIAQRCLQFLQFVSLFHDLDNFIGQDKKNAIRIKIKKYSINIAGQTKKKYAEVLMHSSIPTPDAVKRKLPVSNESALKVWNFIQNQGCYEKRVRDIALYQCMEQLGARVTELHLITVEDVNQALKLSTNPSIKLTNLKRKDQNSARSLPITAALLTDINQYTKVRRKVLKRTQKAAKSKGLKPIDDHGYLFISLTTGKPLQSSTLSTYLNQWKKKLGIRGELHPHLYRHAFITNKLKELILQHKELNSADDFKKHFLNSESFKLELQQWTGHKNIQSLDTYINLAFSDINGYSKAYKSIQLKDSVVLVKRQISRLKKQLKKREVTVTQATVMMEEILSAFEDDIENAS